MVEKKHITTGIVIIIIAGIALGIFLLHPSSSFLSHSSSLKSPHTFIIGKEEIVEGLSLTVLEVNEDSRCPAGVTCIWEGRVVAKVALSFNGQSKTGPIALGETVPFAPYAVSLDEVTPGKVEGKEIDAGDYRLKFSIKKTGTSDLNKTYTNETYGISFSYPPSYYLEEREEKEAGRTHHAIVLTADTEENKNVREGKTPPRDGPVSISFDIYVDPLSAPSLLEWLKETPSSNFNLSSGTFENSVLGGENAVAYHWSGLYENDTTATEHKGAIVAATVAYIQKSDPIYVDFQNIVKSVQLK